MPDPLTSADLRSLADELASDAAAAGSGRAVRVFHAAPAGALSQVLLALTSGSALSEHENPGEAFLHVLRGRVRLTAGDEEAELGPDEHLAIPQRRHHLLALEDAVALLTIARDRSR